MKFKNKTTNSNIYEKSIKLLFITIGYLKIKGKLVTVFIIIGKSTRNRTAKSYHWRNYDFPKFKGAKRLRLPFKISGISLEIGHWRVPFLGCRLPFAIQLIF